MKVTLLIAHVPEVRGPSMSHAPESVEADSIQDKLGGWGVSLGPEQVSPRLVRARTVSTPWGSAAVRRRGCGGM